MKETHDEEIKQFNDRWEYTLFKLSETSKKIEDDLHRQHENEMAALEEEINASQMPTVKYSAGLLNKQYKLKQLVKVKKYAAAKELQEDIRQQEIKETEAAQLNYGKSVEKMRENRAKKHAAEYEAVKARLEKSINSKLKQRMTEYEQLLLRIQNCHNDMMNKQSVEFGKIQAVHAKLLAKYNLNIDDLSNRYDQIQEEDHQIMEQGGYEEVEVQNRPKGNFSKHLESSSQGDANMRIVEENFEEESSHANVKGNAPGQINGYWQGKDIQFKEDEDQSSKRKEGETTEKTNGFNNFHKIESGQSDSGSNTSGSSSSSRKSSSSSSSGSSSSSDSESD